jgi:predicted DNA-binding protein
VGQRTTLTLEDDVFSRLQAEARRTGKTMKSVVNEAIRRGLDSPSNAIAAASLPEARDLGLRPGFDLDDVEATIERLEGTRHR